MINDIPQPLWILKTAKEERLQRLVHMSADMARQVGEMVRKCLLELEPRRSGNFVMVANKYAEVGMWEKVEHVRSGMRDRGLKKMAGVSSVQVGSSIHRFFSGDDSQIAYNDIYLLLDRLNLHMKMVNFESSI